MRGKFIRSLAKWAFRILAITVIVAVGLVFADSLHERKCRGVASHKGKSFEFMGERLTFLNTGQETKGEVLEIEVSFRPTAETNILKWQDGHVHPHQEERFKVISGAVRFRVDDREEVLTAGQSISGPPNVYHTWNSADGKEVKILAELRPALNTDAAAAGFVNAGSMEGKMSLLQAVVIMSEYDGLAYPSKTRALLMQALVKVLAPIGRLVGYKAC